jgi:hypothetical protein
MAGERFELSSTSGYNGTPTTYMLVDRVHFHYPVLLLLVFLLSFVANSIITAAPSPSPIESVVTGPGGKPLPQSAKKTREEEEKSKLRDFTPGRKLVFIWLSAGVIATFVGSGTNIVVHALTDREHGWWCGEATAVGETSPSEAL